VTRGRTHRLALLVLLSGGALACPSSNPAPAGGGPDAAAEAPTGVPACGGGSGTSVVLVPEHTSPDGIAVDAQGVYWRSIGGVFRANKDGTNVVQVGAGSAVGQLTGILAFGDHVYWSDQAGVFRALKDGSDLDLGAEWAKVPQSVASSGITLAPLAMDAVNLYGAGNVIAAFPLATGGDGTVIVPYAPVKDARQLAVNGASFYWTNPNAGTVSMARKDGSNPRVIHQGQTPQGIVADDDAVYWFDEFSATLFKANADGTNPAPLYVTPMANRGPQGGQLAADATTLYWTGTAGQIGRIGKDGSNQTFLQPPAGIGSVAGLAVDAEAIYWTRNAIKGAIGRTCK
jgi:hypothetical protein